MAQEIAVGIDVGTYEVKVVITLASETGGKRNTRIIGTGIAESKGLRHGYIINKNEVAHSIRLAASQASKAANGYPIKRAYISIGGVGVGSFVSVGTVVIGRADLEITEEDVKESMIEAEKAIPQSISINKKIVHSIPIGYRIDGKPTLGSPEGLKGTKLESRVLFVMCLENHLNDLIEAVEDAGILVADVMASPIAGSFVTLTKTQKIAGCVLANIGSETVSIIVYENGIPISLEVFPIGSTDITNDIALGLKVPLEEAESIKRGGITGATYPRKKLDEIVSARLSDIFELIDSHLQKIGRSGMLPAGIIITGGGSGVGRIEDIARDALKLPSKIGRLEVANGGKIQDSSWSVAHGLALAGLLSEDESTLAGIGVGKIAKKIWGKFLSWVKQFLP
ncbi:MAG: hypothetical protein COV34_01260 [Candidatus Zambryskibacteria bacterium CG10_big_fil_rev_8_21_14_0_10_42_12]|uniref:Cell division protein FtsA n=1 Tax=Candidatus Zambryskibacteria bacterium CG10_big_fil_rev_8_21_14_0_10_42_12 TaxID=1975115 RepID=A0A2H0QX82_9BACT|nr:MAG: hypothetical protein COV34_01260 [Candidatus Zambryskibacteria bacterium CG10_big_fil_rev_8_21_14_0_10_42_12]